jgi:L-serine dehydratase
MAISVFELFKIGIGPSSSHTVGPMRAALQFVTGLQDSGLLARTESVKAELFGSLGATGKGHGSDKAVLLGLQGEAPDLVDTDAVPDMLAAIRQEKRINLLGCKKIAFVESEHLLMYRKPLPFHPNGMRFAAYDASGGELCSKVYYSVGGGFVVNEDAVGVDRIVPDTTVVPYPFKTASELLDLCR